MQRIVSDVNTSAVAPGRWADETGIVAPMRIPKAAELLAARLRHEILVGGLVPGETLPSEARLLEVFGVGRPALREAQRILESEGLIQVQRGARGGALVTVPDGSIAARAGGLWLQYHGVTLRDVYDTRAILEGAAVERLAEFGTDADHDAIAAAIEDEQRTAGDRVQWLEEGMHFHARLVELAGLQSMRALSEMLQEITVRHIRRRRDLPVAEDWTTLHRRATRAHLKLLDLVRSRNGARTNEYWCMHMNRASEFLFRDDESETVLDLFDAGSLDNQTVDASWKAADVLADRLRRRIVHGELPDGRALPPESQLADEMGVGRPALREALRILESEQLVSVERGAHGGARVRAPSVAAATRALGISLQLGGTSLEDLYETRALIEPAAARSIAEHGDAADHEALRALVDSSGALVDDPIQWEAAALRFSQEIAVRSRLETLGYLSRLLHGIIEGHWRSSPNTGPRTALEPARMHRSEVRLVSLIEARDGRAAEAMWRSNLDATVQRLFAGGEGDVALNVTY